MLYIKQINSRDWRFFGGGLILTGLLAWIFWPSSPAAHIEKYPLLDPGSMVVNEQDLFVRFQPLRSSIFSQYENHEKFHIGLYFEYLPTGANIVVNNDRPMWPASLIKIPVAMAAMKKVDQGEWRLDDRLVLLGEDKDASFGDLYKKPTGTKFSLDELLYQTLVKSDNTAHFILLRHLYADDIKNVFIHLGLEEVLEGFKKLPGDDEVDVRMTPKNYSVFFRSLFNSTYLSLDSSQYLLRKLSDEDFVYLRGGLPDNINYAHKIGIRIEKGVWADSGIVYVPRRPYILTVMLEKKPEAEVTEEEVAQLFREISSQIYTYVAALQ